jgi:hypothetical protein
VANKFNAIYELYLQGRVEILVYSAHFNGLITQAENGDKPLKE